MVVQIGDFLLPTPVRSWLSIGEHEGFSGIEQAIDIFISTTRFGYFQHVRHRLQKGSRTTSLENDLVGEYEHGRLTGV